MKTGKTLVLAVAFTGILSAQFPDFTPPSPLIGALMHNDTAEARRLLAEGADPNTPEFFGFPPVLIAVANQNLELFRAMVEKGADVHARDKSGSTALMWAAFNETGDTAMVEELLRMGLDPSAANLAGETALTWASRRGHTAMEMVLRRAGASDAASVKDAAQRAIALLQKSGPQFVRASGCVSCHHQFVPQMAMAIGRERGLTIDEKSARLQTASTVGVFKPMLEAISRSKDRIPDPPVTASYALLALAAENYPADETTQVLAQLIAGWQNEDGGFRALPMRPPMEGSHFTATALSLRAMQLYGKNSEEQVMQAREWLRRASPKSTEDRAMQMLGLAWANAGCDEVRERARDLMAEQRPDGGWAQLPGLETDAYATGQALVAMHWGAGMKTSDPAFQRGIAYLVRTQFADGSWLVRSRTFPFQPYKESGFPHGKNQWISAAGTGWAAMALSLALPMSAPDGRMPIEMSQRGGTH